MSTLGAWQVGVPARIPLHHVRAALHASNYRTKFGGRRIYTGALTPLPAVCGADVELGMFGTFTRRYAAWIPPRAG